MKTLIKKLSAFLSFGLFHSLRTDHFQANEIDRADYDEYRWEDALMACMYDENARSYLDYYGARGR